MQEEKNEKNEKNENDLIFEKLLKGEDITEKIETDRGEFLLKYPLQKEHKEIIKKRIKYLEDLNIDNLTDNELTAYNVIAILDTVIIKSPEWWTSAYNIFNIDYSLILELYRGYLLFSRKIQDHCNNSRIGKDDNRDDRDNKNETMGIGLFSGSSK